MYKSFFIFIILFQVVLSAVYADGVSVHVSQRKVALNDSFQVTFSTSHGIKTAPDFSPLLADFEIVSNAQDNSITFMNGHMTHEVRWNLALIAKREGDLIIPSIQFDGHASSPQAIEVTKSLGGKQDDAIFIETELFPKESVYEGSLLTYIVRLYCSVNMAQATLSELSVSDKDAIIERLGNDTEYNHNHTNGKLYRVYERKYSVFPQHAGELVIAPSVFEGALISGGNSFFNMQTKIKRLTSEAHTIIVKPIPAPFTKDNWLAANDVRLSEEWSTDPSKAIAGEPITWTIKQTVNGCMGDHIPNISLSFPIDVKHYFDKAETSNQVVAGNVTGIKQVKVAIIPTKSGQFEMPKVSVPWLDLKTNEIRYADLPPRSLNVSESVIAMNTPPQNENPIHPVSDQVEDQLTADNFQQFGLIWIIVGVLVLALIGCVLLWSRCKTKSAKPDSLRQLRNELKNACLGGKAKQAEKVLLLWFSQRNPNDKYLNISAIKQNSNEKFKDALQGLNQALYGKDCDWNGNALWEAFCDYELHIKKQSKPKKGQQHLPELYN